MEFYYHAVDNDVLILSVDGGLMSDNTATFTGELERYIGLGIQKLIVDCTKLTRITSSGLGTLVRLHKKMAKKGGDVKLASVPGGVGKIVQMTGLGRMFEIYPTIDDALQAFEVDENVGPAEIGPDASTHPDLDPDSRFRDSGYTKKPAGD